MGLRDRVRDWLIGETVTPIAEGKSTDLVVTPPTNAKRVGFEYGTSITSSSSSAQVAESAERLQILNQLHQAYLTCPWVSAPIDLIARTVTAGGLQVVYDTDADDEDTEVPPDPPEVTRLRRLLRFVNPYQDMVQLLRACVIDLKLFGDCYLEVVSIAGEPVALYTLDATTMTVVTDPHGEVEGYVQQTEGGKKAEFDVDQVIHISLDAPRGGVYGVSPAQKALLPVTAWLFTEATIKECFRRGDPPRVHVDLPRQSDGDVQKWREQYQVYNLGPKAVGTPVITVGGGHVQVLDPRKVMDYLETSRQLRDEIIATFGVPPAKLGIIESGNLGGGTGEAQDKTFRVNTVIPIQALVLEKINFHLLQQGFGIAEWHLEFGEIDYRDSQVVEQIRDMRLRNGTYTLNRLRDEIGEPPVEGGDEPVLVDRQNLVLWADIPALSKAGIAYKLKGTALEPTEQEDLTEPAGMEKPEPNPVPPTLAPFAGQGPDPNLPPDDRPGGPNDAAQGEPPKESVFARDVRKLDESWMRSYRARRREALKELPQPEEVS